MLQCLRQYKESHNESEILMSALSAMQDKNAHLENSLSAETRIKLDLFSALGEAKRQLEIRESECNHCLSLWTSWGKLNEPLTECASVKHYNFTLISVVIFNYVIGYFKTGYRLNLGMKCSIHIQMKNPANFWLLILWFIELPIKD